MKLIQLKDIDGYNLALYTCPDEVDTDVLEKKINALEHQHIDDDNVHEIIDERLSADLGVKRVVAEEIFAETL